MSNKRKNYPLHILPAHFEEWVTDSGVNERITTLSIESLSDPNKIDALLDRNTKSRWKHWEYGAGWSVTGVNYITGEQIYDGAQFKPDNPVQRVENGEPKFKKDGTPDLQKYFSVTGEETCPLFLDTGEPGYWIGVLNDPSQTLLITEGAKKAGAALSAGVACISIPGVGCGQKKGRLKKDIKAFCQTGRVMTLAFDSDLFFNSNVCRELDRLGRLLVKEGAAVSVLVLPRDTKGLDDYVVAYGYEAFRDLVAQAITFEEWRELYIKREIQQVRSPMDFIPEVEDNVQLKAQEALFKDRWVSIDGDLYQWTGTHYQLQSETVMRRRIAEWCRSTPVYVQGEWRYSYATATTVSNIYAWVVEVFGIDPALVNPPGLNCLNGVLQVTWKGRTPQWSLQKHNPDVVYTYVGEFEFNSNADSTACDKLLQCLEPPQREIFIKTMAASLDLKSIRAFKGRAIRALLCKGDGNNGKDSLREAVAILYGVGVVNATVSDFQIYDGGKKFPLAKLEHARISWSSENSSFRQLDSLQSLKAAITGEPIDIERKNKDERPMSLSTVFLFNINNVPNLQASLEAIQSRWAVLSFDKTFKTGADPARGELEADPRFRYDPEFIKREVVPSLLNKMLAALPEVAMNGIDYSCTEEKLEEIQQEINHLRRFAKEVGLVEHPGSRVYINDLWEKLREWYIANGTLVVSTDGKGKEKLEWHDQPQRGDKNVKAPNQIYQRFHEIFPKVRRERETHDQDRVGQSYLLGLGFGKPGEFLQPLPEEISMVGKVIQLLKKLSPEDREIVRKTLNAGDNVVVNDSLASYPHMARSSGSLTPSLTASDDSKSALINTLSTDSVNPSSGSVAYVGSTGDTTVSNCTKNFPASDVSSFKVGDKCIAQHPCSIYVPNNTELTIKKIEGDKAFVTFPGCRTRGGVQVELRELRKCNGQE